MKSENSVLKENERTERRGGGENFVATVKRTYLFLRKTNSCVEGGVVVM
jgi:hypothetical protein